jgi:hypothetical protein
MKIPTNKIQFKINTPRFEDETMMIIPRYIIDLDITTGARLLAAYLWINECDEANNQTYFTKSLTYDEIAKFFGKSTRAIYNDMMELTHAGVMAKIGVNCFMLNNVLPKTKK